MGIECFWSLFVVSWLETSNNCLGSHSFLICSSNSFSESHTLHLVTKWKYHELLSVCLFGISLEFLNFPLPPIHTHTHTHTHTNTDAHVILCTCRKEACWSRCCIQVAVSPVGMGSNPTPDKPAFWASLVAQLVKNPPAMQETGVQSLGWKDPLEEGMATPSSVLAWRISMGRGAWWGTVHGVARVRHDKAHHRKEEILHKKCNIRVMHWGEIEDPEMTPVGLHFTLDCS